MENNRVWFELFQNAFDALALLDEESRIVEWNQQAELLFGWFRMEAIGQSIVSLVIPQNQQQKFQTMLREMRGKLTQFRSHQKIEITLQNRDSTQFPAELFFVKASTSNEVCLFFRDISDRRHLEEQLLEAEERYRNLFEKSVEGLFQCTSDGGFVNVNPALVRILGFDTDIELMTAFFDPAHFYADRGDWEKLISALAKDGSVKDYQCQVFRSDGSLIWISQSAYAITDRQGQMLYYEGSFEDVTNRKKLQNDLVKAKEEAEEANRIKSKFLATMTHELRTPLNAIIGYSEMLQEEAIDLGLTEMVSDLQRVHSAGKHLLTLINDILDLSKIEAGKMDLYIENFDPADVIRDVVATIEPLVKKNRNQLQCMVEGSLPRMTSDVTRIRQVLFNLLSNACKFTTEGIITLQIVSKSGTPSSIQFRVADTGIGMSHEQMQKLFQSFTQAEAGTTRKYGGSGLGLAISRKLCNMLGGEISVESEPGKGTSFIFVLPANVYDTMDKTEDEELAKQAPEDSMKEATTRVLVIDDEPNACELIARQVQRDGFTVTKASSGPEGIRLARETKPQLIILDILMPGMDGWAVLTALKTDPDLAPIPVVLVSMIDEREMASALGAADYLIKPVDRAKLSAILQSHLAMNLGGVSET